MKYKPLLIYLLISSIFLTLLSSIWKIMATLQGLKLTEINFNMNFILALLLIFGFLNTIMPGQIDNRMVNMSEHQREGVGLILGSIWLWFSRLLIGSKTS